MAGYGALKPQFFPIEGDGTTESPKAYGAKKIMGKMIKADMTITTANGQLYGDDALIEEVNEFVSATVTQEVDDMRDDVATIVFGAKVENGTVTYNKDDVAPLGGYAYIKKLMRDKVTLFKGYFYPQAKAALGNDTAQTKGNSITFGTSSFPMTIFADENGDWRLTHEADTEEEVQTWIDAQAAKAPAVGS